MAGARVWLRALVQGLCVALTLGCEVGSPGGESGCLRVSQGDYTFPDKRVLSSSIAARVTRSGIDFLTQRIKSLVLAFFQADANGRAVIPLASLGVGTLSTSLGPFSAQVRDVVLTVDLSRLEVRLIPGTSPARLEILVVDAEVGLVEGTIAGGISGTFFSGDAACGLANGPRGRVALLTMRLSLELGTEPNGDLRVRVLPSSFDLQDIAITFVTDCDERECLDGLPTGSTSECLECETICPVADFGAQIATALREALDGVIDALLTLLADELANLVLDGFLNGRPLAVEGQIDLAALLGPLLGWMESARPLGFLGRPAGQAFQVTGTGPSLGLDVLLNAGVDASAHPCAPSPTAERVFGPGPRPVFEGQVVAPGGGLIPYEMALGVSDAVVNQALWALWRSGSLCIRADSGEVALLTSGSGGIVLTAQTLDLLLPGAAELAGPNAPVRIAIRPRMDLGPDYVRFGGLVRPGEASAEEPLVSVTLVESEVGIDVLVGDAWVRLVGFGADLELGLDLTPTVAGEIEVGLGAVKVTRLSLPDNEIITTAGLDVIAPFVVELALSLLSRQGIAFSLGLSGLGASFGVPIEVAVVGMGAAGPESDWLAIYLSFSDPPRAPRRAPVPAVEVVEVGAGDGRVDTRLAVLLRGAGPEDRHRVRVGLGAWSPELVGPGPHRLTGAGSRLVGRWPIEVRAIDHLGRALPPVVRGELEVLPPITGAPEPAAEIGEVGEVGEGPVRDPAVGEGGGCAGAPGPPGLDVWLGWLAVGGLTGWVGLRRRRGAPGRAWAVSRGSGRALLGGVAWLGLGTALGLSATLMACAADSAPERRCATHSQCDNGFLCGGDGFCRPSTACEDDGGCCPGAVCFSGWCRPTAECGEGRRCAGLGEVCENAQCVPAPCDALGGCVEPFMCVAGRCLLGAPCGGRCGGLAGGGAGTLEPGGPGGDASVSTVCDVPSGRCLPAPMGCECPRGFAVNPEAAGGVGDALTCSVGCACAELPEVPAGRPGEWGRIVAVPDGAGDGGGAEAGAVALLSYEPAYGDLVLSRFEVPSELLVAGREGLLVERRDRALDGVPEGDLGAPASPAAYRGGLLDPGPDRGDRVVALVASGAGQGGPGPVGAPSVDAIYRDRDLNQLVFGRFAVDPDDGAGAGGGGSPLLSSALPVEGLGAGSFGSGTRDAAGPDLGVGRYACLQRRSDGTYAGLAFVGADLRDEVSLLVRFESRTPEPRNTADWVATTVLETPLPPREQSPCDGACGFGEACVVAPSGVRACAGLIDLGALTGGATASCGSCNARQVCAEVEGVKGCHARVERRDDLDRLPFGEGLFVSCAVDLAVGSGGRLAAAWYDADRRRLVAGRWPFSAADRAVVDVGPGRDPGRFASLAAHAGGLTVAYQDAATAELKVATQASASAAWATEIVPASPGDNGLWARVAVAGGTTLVLAGEGRRGDVLLFAKEGGCWAERRVLSNGAYSHPDLALGSGDAAGGVWVSARLMTFDEALAPRHAPVIARVGIPRCL